MESTYYEQKVIGFLEDNGNRWTSWSCIYFGVLSASGGELSDLENIHSAVQTLLKSGKLETALIPSKDTPHTQKGPMTTNYRLKESPIVSSVDAR